MSGIRGVNTRPELILRKALFAEGFRYRLHVRQLPGKPDMVFPRYKAVFFAHGCFWHGHNCHLFKLPASRTDFWTKKIERNRIVDMRNETALTEQEWRVGVVWECALKGRAKLPLGELIASCVSWLNSRQHHLEIRGMS